MTSKEREERGQSSALNRSGEIPLLVSSVNGKDNRRRRDRSCMWWEKYPPRGYSLAGLRMRDETLVEEGKSATFADVES